MSNFANFETTKAVARASVNAAASQTTWTPASGKRIRLNAFSIAASGAGPYEVYLGSTLLFTIELAAAGTFYWHFPAPGMLGSVDGTLTVKNNNAGAMNVASSAWGREEV